MSIPNTEKMVGDTFHSIYANKFNIKFFFFSICKGNTLFCSVQICYCPALSAFVRVALTLFFYETLLGENERLFG
jgi:hypothetical protein